MERQSWLDANFVCYVIQGSRLTQQLLLLRHSPKAIGFLICICSHRLFLEKITSSSYAFSERAALKHEIGNPETETESRGAIHSTKLSGNFGPKLNGSVRSNRKSFEKTGPPFEVVLFSRSDRLEFWLDRAHGNGNGNKWKRNTEYGIKYQW